MFTVQLNQGPLVTRACRKARDDKNVGGGLTGRCDLESRPFMGEQLSIRADPGGEGE